MITAMVAVMVGIRESTGTAPPPPIFVTERVEWLSPELDRPDLDIVLEAAPSINVSEARSSIRKPTTILARAAGALRRTLNRL
jgi:hypothetical protein